MSGFFSPLNRPVNSILFFIYLIYLFIFGCFGSSLLQCGLSLVAVSGGLVAVRGLLIAVASPVAEHGL